MWSRLKRGLGSGVVLWAIAAVPRVLAAEPVVPTSEATALFEAGQVNDGEVRCMLEYEVAGGQVTALVLSAAETRPEPARMALEDYADGELLQSVTLRAQPGETTRAVLYPGLLDKPRIMVEVGDGGGQQQRLSPESWTTSCSG
jgi:hypothetical protein